MRLAHCFGCQSLTWGFEHYVATHAGRGVFGSYGDEAPKREKLGLRDRRVHGARAHASEFSFFSPSHPSCRIRDRFNGHLSFFAVYALIPL